MSVPAVAPGPVPGPASVPASGPPLALELAAQVDERGLDLHLDVPTGSVVAVVGPNGSGKSSLLRLIGGTLRPSAGTVRIDGELVSGPKAFVAVHRRRVAVLDQRPLLFEHLDVLDNVAFGPRSSGVGKAAARALALTQLELVGCADLAGNRSWELSGGQAQRVALARALAASPRLLLLDEPMAALDVTVATAVRALLRDRLGEDGRTALIVTHDVLDALALADTLAVVEDGRVADVGPVGELLARPRTPFLAGLVGVNLLAGTAVAGDAIDVAGTVVTGLPYDDRPLRAGVAALATIPPEAVSVHLDDDPEHRGSPRNTLPAVVTAVEPRGALARVTCELAGHPERTIAADLTAASVVSLDLRPGLPVRLVVKAAQVRLFAH